MKKSNIIKLFITFICIFAISFVSDKVYGISLRYSGITTNSYGEGILVRTYGTPVDDPYFNDANGYLVPQHKSYQTYGVVFHKEEASIYANGEKISYDINKKGKRSISQTDLLEGDTTNFLRNNIELGKSNVTGEKKYYSGEFPDFIDSFDAANDNYSNIVCRRLKGWAYFARKSVENWGSDPYKTEIWNTANTDSKYNDFVNTRNFLTDNGTIVGSDWFISKTTIEEVKEKDLVTNNEVFFSLLANTNEVNGISYAGITSMKTSKECYDIRNKQNLTDYAPGDTGESILNLFDNKIILPEEYSSPKEVYIKHVDTKGNLINIANSSEIKISNGNESIIKNGGEKTIGENKYQEYYKINLSDKLRVSRSLTIATDGTLYSYDHAVISSGKDAKTADKNNKNSNNIKDKNNPSFEVGNENAKDKSVIVVKFVYNKETVPDYPNHDYPNDVTPPTGDIHTDFGANSNKSDCINKATPTDKDVTPYLKAKKILLKDLRYKLVQNDNKVEYKMEKFNVQQLDSGKIDNNTSEYPETGTIFGNEKYTLFNSGTKKEVNMTQEGMQSGINFAIKFKTENNKGALPTQDVVNTFVNDKKNVSSFADFDTQENKRHIPKDKYNGVRNPKLFAHYKAVDVINTKDISGGLGYIDSKNKVNLIIYNPLELEKIKITSKEIINHTTQSSTTGSNIIQKNAEFTLSLKTKGSSYYTEITDTSEYLDYYYLVFDMNVVLKDNYQIRERSADGESFGPLKTATNGTTVEKGTLIRIEKDKTEFKAIASSNEQNADIVSQIQNNVVLIGVTNNMPSKDLEDLILKNEVKRHIVKNESIEEKYININKTSNVVDFASYCEANYEQKNYHESKYTNNHKMYSDAYYFAMATAKTTNVGRIYDFKVTDCSDLDYKSVFREGSSTTGVNNLKGVQYFSGIKRFNIYTNEINTLEDRENLNISNSAAKKILPLGPYKNTNTSYINAPKLGYRISFDLKTSGYFDEKNQSSTRSITIKPSYYYISKSGDNFNDKITLYYKNSNGKYVKFDGSNYTIYFKPNDGYRFKQNSVEAGNISGLSTKLEPLNIGSNAGFSLNTNMMSRADNDFIQAWYGEFKLPNSTIAVKEGGNISNPLTNGYIGVKFDIKCVDKDLDGNLIRELGYNQNNQNAENKTNTTQWDYEGYLGFTNYGHKVDNITLQLEKGNWKIDDDVYQKIKGTVVLYDTDNRAANDFD